MKHLEIKTIEHKGIKVIARVDYDNQQVDLLEKNMTGYTAKHWVFAGRGLGYMDGWLDIIDAMRIAVLEIKKDLEHDLAEKSKFKERDAVSLMKVIQAADRLVKVKPRKR